MIPEPFLLFGLGLILVAIPVINATFQGRKMSTQQTKKNDSDKEGMPMWFHKTKLGTFWIVESEESHQYYLGFDEDSIGCYQRLEDAIRDIKDKETGNLRWDESRNVAVPEDVVHQWDEGEPENWNKV